VSTKARGRPFTIADRMILVAATADLGLAWLVDLGWSAALIDNARAFAMG
jgi:hypothetical protein